MWATQKKKKNPQWAHPVWYAVQSKAAWSAQPLIKCFWLRHTSSSSAGEAVQMLNKPALFPPLLLWIVVCEEIKCAFCGHEWILGSVCVYLENLLLGPPKVNMLLWNIFQHLPPIRMSAFWATAAFLSRSLYLDQKRKNPPSLSLPLSSALPAPVETLL